MGNSFNDIMLMVYDFDGVMTDNKVYVDQKGNETVQVNRADGLGVSEIKKLDIEQIIISTEKNPVVSARAKKLDIYCLQGIENKNVSFNYPGNKNVFEDLNLEIQLNKTIAFVGSSGSGKSTLLDLVLGLLEPSKGNIFYGSLNHKEIDKNTLRSLVSYVSQQTTLMDASFRENVTIGIDDISDEEIYSVLKRVCLDDVVANLSEGLDTHIGEDGVKLSGGQRQRIALARALLMNPKFLILDEATSALDFESEKIILQTIQNLKEELTIIIVTHKLSSVRFADKICVLENGKVCESGTYDELKQANGKFASLDANKGVDIR